MPRSPALLACLLLFLLSSRVASAACEDVVVSTPLGLAAFTDRLGTQIDACATEARARDALAFTTRHGLEATPARVRDYTRLRTLFELARDGGPFRLRWAVTDREPTAKHVWAAWAATSPDAMRGPSATAECDELSAVLAGLARRVGVRGVGLFWPTSNHTIAAWEVGGQRVLLPTSQVCQSCDATFDATTFDAAKQRTVFEMSTRDVPDGFRVPAALATFLLGQVTAYAGASIEVLDLLRAHRARRLGGSLPAGCFGQAAMASFHATTEGDARALRHYGATELGITGNAYDVFEALFSGAGG